MPITIEASHRATHPKDRSTWPGMAFVVEALLLLVFVTGTLAVLLQLFAQSELRGEDNVELAQAVVLATNAAEVFALDPTQDIEVVQAVQTPESLEGGFELSVVVTPEKSGAGTLYVAQIEVSRAGRVVYALETAGYESASDAARSRGAIVDDGGAGEGALAAGTAVDGEEVILEESMTSAQGAGSGSGSAAGSGSGAGAGSGSGSGASQSEAASHEGANASEGAGSGTSVDEAALADTPVSAGSASADEASSGDASVDEAATDNASPDQAPVEEVIE